MKNTLSIAVVALAGIAALGCNNKSRNKATFPSTQLAVVTDTLPVATNGVGYSAQLTATGVVSSTSWSLASGSLPPGLAINSDGSITGIPMVNPGAQFPLRVRVTEGGNFAEKDLILYAAKMISITTSTLPAGTVGQSYQGTLAAVGGTQPHTWSVTTGALPPGLSVATNGIITGTPTQAGLSQFTVQVVDTISPAGQVTATRQISLTIQ